MKCRMRCTHNKIIIKLTPFMLNAPSRFHVEANEFKHVGLLPAAYKLEQFMMDQMSNVISGNAPT